MTSLPGAEALDTSAGAGPEQRFSRHATSEFDHAANLDVWRGLSAHVAELARRIDSLVAQWKERDPSRSIQLESDLPQGERRVVVRMYRRLDWVVVAARFSVAPVPSGRCSSGRFGRHCRIHWG